MKKVALLVPLIAALTAEFSAFGQNTIGWWKGEDNTLDSASTNNGVAFNGLTYTNGIVGRAFQPGNVGPGLTAGWMRVTNNPSFALSTLSVAAWVRAIYPTPFGYIVNKTRDSGGGGSYDLYTAAPFNTTFYAPRGEGGGAFYIRDGSHHVNIGGPMGNQNKVWDGQWHLLTGTFDGGTVRFYIDGTEQGNGVSAIDGSASISYSSGALDSGALVNNGDLAFADFSLAGTLHYFGDLDEVQLFDGALSAQAIHDLFKAQNPDLISWWEAEGNANDSFGVNHGTVQGTVVMQTGRFGKAFNVSGGVVVVADDSSLRPAAVTLEARIHAAQAPGTNKFLISKSSTSGGPSYGLSTGPDGGLVFMVTTPSGTVSSVDAGTNLWDNEYHVVFGTYEGNSVRLYVDGTEQGTGTAATGAIQYSASQSNGELLFGDFQDTPGTQNFAGHVDEIKIYGRALTGQEVAGKIPQGLSAYITPHAPRVNAGASVTLTANTRGPVSPVNNGGVMLRYQWRKNGVAISTATNSTLVLTALQATNTGQYDVQVIPVGVAFTTNGAGGGSAFRTPIPIRVPDSATLEPDNLTVQVWARSTNAPGGGKYMVAKSWGPNSGTMLSFGLTTVVDTNTANPIRSLGFPMFGVRQTPATANQTTYPTVPGDFTKNLWDGVWHQITGTYDGTTLNLYVDGALAGTTNSLLSLPIYYAHTNQYAAGDLILADYSQYTHASFHWTNDLDEVRIFNRALSAQEVADSYAAITNTPTILTNAPGLVSWWRGENNLLDSVGGNHGLASTAWSKGLTATPASVALFASITNLAVIGGNFQGSVVNANGDTYVVQRSGDLTNWVPIVTNTVPFGFSDSVGSVKNFYRAVLQP